MQASHYGSAAAIWSLSKRTGGGGKRKPAREMVAIGLARRFTRITPHPRLLWARWLELLYYITMQLEPSRTIGGGHRSYDAQNLASHSRMSRAPYAAQDGRIVGVLDIACCLA